MQECILIMPFRSSFEEKQDKYITIYEEFLAELACKEHFKSQPEQEGIHRRKLDNTDYFTITDSKQKISGIYFAMWMDFMDITD